VRELQALVAQPLLGELSLRGSPLATAQGDFYRARVLVRLRQLRLLDGELATAREKVKACAMHGQEHASRRAVAAKHLPTTEFVDFLYVLLAMSAWIRLVRLTGASRRPPLEFEDDDSLLHSGDPCA
jgi:hypothetical protein